jgi:hypothetical protein
MISKIRKSKYVMHVSLLLSVSVLCMSFKSNEDNVQLKSGTPVSMETLSVIKSNSVSVGQIIDFRIKHDIEADGKVVIPAGSLAKGQVVRAQIAKGLGKQGFIEIQIKSVKAVDGQQIYLTGGNMYQEGEDRQTMAIVLGLVVCILFLTMKGKEAQINPGYEVNANVAGNFNIAI